MNKQPEDKTKTTITSEQPSKQPPTTKPTEGELSEQELEKASGGSGSGQVEWNGGPVHSNT